MKKTRFTERQIASALRQRVSAKGNDSDRRYVVHADGRLRDGSLGRCRESAHHKGD
jgi:hypothetical protein